jgi:small-conductance mechanosensitive channel
LADACPNLDEIGKNAANTFLQVMSAMFILIGLITYAARNSPGMVWAYALGFTLFSINTLKHMFIDGINVPITALILQGGIALICIYLWFQQRNTVQ